MLKTETPQFVILSEAKDLGGGEDGKDEILRWRSE